MKVSRKTIPVIPSLESSLMISRMPNHLQERSPVRRVALLVLNASDWSRQVHEGIAAFAREQGNWEFWLQPRGTRERVFMGPHWKGNGIICRLADDELKSELLKLRLPTVNISWLGENTPEIPKVISDLSACSEMCAEYFLNRNFQSFAYIGPQPYLGYVDKAYDAAQQFLAREGYPLSRFEPDPTFDSPDWSFQREALGDWIESLPKPLAIISWSTIVAREAILACQSRAIEVPEEVSVLAIEHDPLLSALSPIQISHVMQRPQAVGYAAAELLDQMMRGRPAPSSPILIAPEGIAEYLSTDIRLGTDDIVNKAITFIHANLHRSIQVSDVTRHVNVSRRSLEDRFRKVLNRTPAEEIRQSRLNHLKKLLKDPSLSLNAVAAKAGFAYQEVMIRFFKRETGQTPGDYRHYTLERTFKPTVHRQYQALR
jgi:LacI family transcriptional regulator